MCLFTYGKCPLNGTSETGAWADSIVPVWWLCVCVCGGGGAGRGATSEPSLDPFITYPLPSSYCTQGHCPLHCVADNPSKCPPHVFCQATSCGPVLSHWVP